MRKTKRKILIIGLIALSIVMLTVLADVLPLNDPYVTNHAAIRMSPCAKYPFGTDNLGRCVLARVIYGGRITIAASFFLVFISFVIGTFLGIMCGYFGGKIDTFCMRLADIVLAFPQMVVAIAVAGILNGGLKGAMISLGITMWVSFARIARSHTLSLKNEAFIQNALLSGKSDFYIIRVHIFPNLVSYVFTNALNQVGMTMIGISGLSFLGLGVVPPNAEWGSMISEAKAYIQIAPWGVIYPSLATLITIVVFNYLGDAVMEYMEK